MEFLNYARTQWDRVAAAVAIAAGLIVLIAGYLGIKDERFVAGQMPYIISGGLLGIFLLGVGAMFWLSADMRDEWRELRGLRDAVAENSRALASRSALDEDLGTGAVTTRRARTTRSDTVSTET